MWRIKKSREEERLRNGIGAADAILWARCSELATPGNRLNIVSGSAHTSGWAEGSVSKHERFILKRRTCASNYSTATECWPEWLNARPTKNFLRAHWQRDWRLLQTLPPEQREIGKRDLVSNCAKVAWKRPADLSDFWQQPFARKVWNCLPRVGAELWWVWSCFCWPFHGRSQTSARQPWESSHHHRRRISCCFCTKMEKGFSYEHWNRWKSNLPDYNYSVLFPSVSISQQSFAICNFKWDCVSLPITNQRRKRQRIWLVFVQLIEIRIGVVKSIQSGDKRLGADEYRIINLSSVAKLSLIKGKTRGRRTAFESCFAALNL